MADVDVTLDPGWEQTIARATRPEWEDAAHELADTATNAAPVRTRELQESIGGRVVDTADGPVVEVVATADHAGFVEDGTRHMEAQPYLRPSLLEVVTKRYAIGR